MVNIDELLDLHKAFWKRENERPLLDIVQEGRGLPWSWLRSDQRLGAELVLRDGSIAKEGTHLTPEIMAPSEKIHPKPATHGDMFVTASPYPKIPWIEAIIGCPIHISVKANAIWSEPYWPENWYEKEIEVPINEDWLDVLLDWTRYVGQNFEGPYMTTTTGVFRGPLDMMDALMGERNVVVSIYRHPEETRRLLSILTEIFIKVNKMQIDLIPRFRGGMVNCFGVWAPGSNLRSQEDASNYISPKLYKEFVVPCDERMHSAFDYSAMHIHAAEFIHADVITDEKYLGALQMSMEPPPYGPNFDDCLKLFSRIIKKKPLILQASTLTSEQVDRLLSALPPQGLYLQAAVPEPGREYYVYR